MLAAITLLQICYKKPSIGKWSCQTKKKHFKSSQNAAINTLYSTLINVRSQQLDNLKDFEY